MRLIRHLNDIESQFLTDSLNKNALIIRNMLKNDATVVERTVSNQFDPQVNCRLFFSSPMVNNQLINNGIIEPILSSHLCFNHNNLTTDLMNRVIISSDIKQTSRISIIVNAIVSGNTIILVNHSDKAIIVNTKGWEKRSIEEPEAEKTLRGPKEGFTETLDINISLVRRRILDTDLSFEFGTLGTKSKTKYCICYVKSIVKEEIINELRKRISDIEIDNILDTGVIQELIKDEPYTPFKTIGSTERPDVAVAKLMEGRVMLLLDGSPITLTVPQLFIEYFQSPDDYYKGFYYGSLNRLLRIIAYFISIGVPGFYIAIITFHQEMIPTSLLLNIYSARQGIPIPTILEALLLLFAFEVLRETGSRMPTYIGQAMSIVGALVLGQAAVDARFVSAPMVIVIALTGITGLMLPNLTGSLIVLRAAIVFFSTLMGLYGFLFILSALLLHLYSLRSFGVPYMSNLNLLQPSSLKDSLIRAPWWFMEYRPKAISYKNQKRNVIDNK